MDIKALAEKAISALTGNTDLLAQFKEDPKAAIKSIIGELDDDIISKVIEAVKEKLSDSDGLLGGLVDKIGGLFGKKDD